MKNIIKYLFALVVAIFTLSACNENVTPHEPGEPEEAGCYGVFFPSQTSAYTLDPAEPTQISVKVSRTNTSGAIEVPYTFTASVDGIFSVGAISFADGQSETSVKVEFPSSEVGTKYTGSFVISDNKYASKYNSGAIAFDFSVTREKWNDLGFGSIEDTWWYFDKTEVKIWQNDKDKNMFRVEMGANENMYSADQDEYLTFKVMKAGETTYSQKVPTTGIVAFNTYHTGYIHSSYGAEIVVYFPGSFSSLSDPSNWTHNKVLQYQDNGLPAGVQLAPMYYMSGVGGWNQTQEDGIITIIFPGAVLTDFSIDVTTDYTDGNAVTPLTFTVGKDVTSVKYACFEGELNSAQITRQADAIIGGSVESKEISEFEETEEGEFVASEGVSFENSGVYTVVAVSFADGTAKESAASTFLYVSAEDIESSAVTVVAGTEATPARYEGEDYSDYNSFAFFVAGKELTDVHLLITTVEKFAKNSESYCADLKADHDYAVSDDVLASINRTGGYYSVATGLQAETQYVLLIWATNGKLDTFKAVTYTTGASPEVWKSLGMCQYTDDIIASIYDEIENLTYELEILESEDNPGKYRLVNPYGAAFAYNEEGDYDDSKDYYLEIDATDPDYVNIHEQYFGVDWTYGEIGVISAADYYLMTGQATIAQLKEYGYYGTLEDGVITFGKKALLVIEGGQLYYGNLHSAFKVVLPEAVSTDIACKPATGKSTKHVTRSTSNIDRYQIATGEFEREGNAVSFSSKKIETVVKAKEKKELQRFEF